MGQKFGIEIEYAGPKDDLTYHLKENGIPVQDDDYEGDYSRYWSSKTDGSVYNGGELASRILDWSKPNDLAELVEVVRLAREVGCAPSEQAGIHIHVDCTGMTDKQVGSLAYGFVRHEDWLYRVGSAGWDHVRENARTYAHPYSKHNKTELFEGGFSGNTVLDVGNRDRYNGLNLGGIRTSSVNRRVRDDWVVRGGTAEYRLFNSTMNPERALSYAATAVGFAIAARKNKLGTPKLNKYNCYPLGGMHEGWRTSPAVYSAAMRVLSSKNTVLSAKHRALISKSWMSSVPQSIDVFGHGFRIAEWSGDRAVRKRRVVEPAPVVDAPGGPYHTWQVANVPTVATLDDQNEQVTVSDFDEPDYYEEGPYDDPDSGDPCDCELCMSSREENDSWE